MPRQWNRPTLAAGSGASAMIGPARAQELLRLLELPALERHGAARLTFVTPTIGSADQPSRSAIPIASRRSRLGGCEARVRFAMVPSVVRQPSSR